MCVPYWWCTKHAQLIMGTWPIYKKHFLQLILTKKTFHLIKYLLATFIFVLSFQSVLVLIGSGQRASLLWRIMWSRRNPGERQCSTQKRLWQIQSAWDAAQNFLARLCMLYFFINTFYEYLQHAINSNHLWWYDMGHAMNVRLSCYLVLLSNYSKTRKQDRPTFVT